MPLTTRRRYYRRRTSAKRGTRRKTWRPRKRPILSLTRTTHRPFVTRPIGPSRKIAIKLRYQDTWFDLTTVAAGFQTYNIFSGNSCYDPDYTGVGVQPYAWDELSALYSYYKVYASKIRITLYPSTTVANCAKQVVVCYPYGDGGLPTNHTINDLRQIHKCRWMQLAADRYGNKALILKNYQTTKNVWKGMYNPKDNDFTAAVTANPTRRWFWHVLTDTVDMQAGATIKADIAITYYLKMEYRIPLAQS